VSTKHPTRPPGESTLDTWFEDGTVRSELELAAGVDPDEVRTKMLTLLDEAATGQYWAGRWKHVDLDERWHRLLVTVGDGAAGLGGGPLDSHHSKRVATRDLVEAARQYLESHGTSGR
jgi:hypothetical protein